MTGVVPKPATPLLDVPLGAFALDGLVRVAAPVIVNASHLSDALERSLEPFAPRDRVEILVEHPDPYGTAATLDALRDRLGDPFVVRNADALSDVDVADLLAAHKRNDAGATLAVRRVSRGADFQRDPSGRTRLVDRRAHPGAAGALYLGAAVLDASTLDLVRPGRPPGLAAAVFGPLAADGRLELHEHAGYWRDVGRLADYLAASLELLAGRGPVPPVSWPGEIVEVEGGLAYLGPGADAGRGRLGPGAVMLTGALLEDGTSVEDAVVWPGERVPAGESLRSAVWALGRSLDASGA